MAELYASSNRSLSLYTESRCGGRRLDCERKLRESTTLYVGNLSYRASEEQIYELFSRVGHIKRIVMGLHRIKKTPCGFCFVEYFRRVDAEHSVHFLSDTTLDSRRICIDYDIGFSPGREYGRGRYGGQRGNDNRWKSDVGIQIGRKIVEGSYGARGKSGGRAEGKDGRVLEWGSLRKVNKLPARSVRKVRRRSGGFPVSVC